MTESTLPTAPEGPADLPDPAAGLDIGSEAAASQPATQVRPQPAPDAGGFFWGTGRRKSAVARVRLRPGTGQFRINRKEVADYLPSIRDQKQATAALEATKTLDKLDVFVTASGGGTTGQADAVLLGVARALKNFDPGLEQTLRDAGYLTRDPREVERKKYGRPGARRRFQFSKR